MKKFLFSLITCFCIISLLSFNIFAEQKNYSWYCSRTDDHTQPTLNSEISFIEEYGGYYVDKRYGNDSSEKVIYLTFDAGYENGNVGKILNVLKNENVSGAFFILSNLIIKNPSLVLKMKNEGHTVCNHTSKHPDITKFETAEELKGELGKLENLYCELTGEEMPKYFRPPEGRFNRKSMENISKLGYKTIFWSFAYADWDNSNQPSEEYAKEKILSNVHNGEIMLLHPTSSTNVKVLGEVIRELKKQGYRFGTLDELTSNA